MKLICFCSPLDDDSPIFFTTEDNSFLKLLSNSLTAAERDVLLPCSSCTFVSIDCAVSSSAGMHDRISESSVVLSLALRTSRALSGKITFSGFTFKILLLSQIFTDTRPSDIPSTIPRRPLFAFVESPNNSTDVPGGNWRRTIGLAGWARLMTQTRAWARRRAVNPTLQSSCSMTQSL